MSADDAMDVDHEIDTEGAAASNSILGMDVDQGFEKNSTIIVLGACQGLGIPPRGPEQCLSFVLNDILHKDIRYVSAGSYHFVAITSPGEVYTWGLNSSGQLGTGAISDDPTNGATSVDSLITKVAVSASCGEEHTAIVMENGEVAMFGRADLGQLGLGPEYTGTHTAPKIIRYFKGQNVRHVTCGENHSLFLMDTGEVFGCGDNQSGQLGLGKVHVGAHGETTEPPAALSVPAIIPVLSTLPIIYIASGANHCVALTVNGQLYTWGRGKHGALGHGNTANVPAPSLVRGLRDICVVDVACGREHTLALTHEGLLFSFGANAFHQCGLQPPHAELPYITTPQQIISLENAHVVHIACGANHSACITIDSHVYTWGLNEEGQLGFPDRTERPVPVEVSYSHGKATRVVCGTDVTLLVTYGANGKMRESNKRMKTSGEDMEVLRCRHDHIHIVERNSVEAHFGLDMSASSAPFIRFLDTVFSHMGPLNASFQRSGCHTAENKSVDLEAVQHFFKEIQRMDGTSLSEEPFEYSSKDLTSLIAKYTPPPRPHVATQDDRQDLILRHDDKVSDRALIVSSSNASTVENQPIRLLDVIVNAAIRGLSALTADSVVSMNQPESLNIFLILYRIPILWQKPCTQSLDLCYAFARVMSFLPTQSKQILRSWFSTYEPYEFSRMVQIWQNHLTEYIVRTKHIDDRVSSFIHALDILNNANDDADIIPYFKFYNSIVSDAFDVRQDYHRWKQNLPREKYFAWCNFPFILEPGAKAKVLHIDAEYRMAIESSNAVIHSFISQLMGQQPSQHPYFVIHVRRDHIVADALTQINIHPHDFKKPLKVIFEGEEGIDEGGVRKEFFQLVVRDIFDPVYGMFVEHKENNTFWFNGTSTETEGEYTLIGVILGLAIYNDTILDVHFPMVIWRKLLRKCVRLEDLASVSEDLLNGLQKLADYEGDDVEDVFCLDFSVAYEYFGEKKIHELKENGSHIAVTSENKHEYVQLYYKYILEESIKKQFESFLAGFELAIGGPALKLFKPEELELLVCGKEDLDFHVLQQTTLYDAGYSKDHPTIKLFWEVMHSLDLVKKKKFLFFLTGCDRAPIKGLGDLKFIIQRAGPDTGRLPTAHTCFNLLVLPEYKTKERLSECLLKSIMYSEGFGLQ